jgi:hypothetical protein
LAAWVLYYFNPAPGESPPPPQTKKLSISRSLSLFRLRAHMCVVKIHPPIAVCCSVLQCVVVCVPGCCNVLQCVAVSCSVLQSDCRCRGSQRCIAVCCSV